MHDCFRSILLKQFCLFSAFQENRHLRLATPEPADSVAVTEELRPNDIARIVGGSEAAEGDYPYYGTKLFNRWRVSLFVA